MSQIPKDYSPKDLLIYFAIPQLLSNIAMNERPSTQGNYKLLPVLRECTRRRLHIVRCFHVQSICSNKNFKLKLYLKHFFNILNFLIFLLIF